MFCSPDEFTLTIHCEFNGYSYVSHENIQTMRLINFKTTLNKLKI